MIGFAKYHGLGNDFLVVDLRGNPASEDAIAIQDPAVVRALCDRQFGVGGDGVLALLPAESSDARMRVLNADGSEAEMCGNGLRCVVKYLRERGGVARDRITIDTGAGALACEAHGGDHVDSVTVDMGAPRMTRGEIPMTGPADERCLEVQLREWRVTAVSMGNPHAVIFVERDDDLRSLAARVGPVIEVHPWFPRRTNVELARVRSPQSIELVVWERGVGITLACGTGACATVVAACATGRAKLGDEIAVELPGGTLSIRVTPDQRSVFMRGPAVHVFDGTVEPRAVAPRPGA